MQTVLRQRPTIATVFGILNILFGLINICASIFTVAMTAGMSFFPLPDDAQIDNPVWELMNEPGGYRTFMTISLFLGFIHSIALIAAGIGLLNTKEWARRLTIGCGTCAVVMTILGLIVNVVFMYPVMLEQFNNVDAGPAAAGAVGGIIGGVIGALIGLAFPICQLVFMTRPKFRDAMRGIQATGAGENYTLGTTGDPSNPYQSPFAK